MPLKMIRGDITAVTCDAIVNAANETLLGGGGVDGAIHRAAGKELLEECRKLGGCETGQAKITKGYALPCRYVIHTVGPVWYGGMQNEEALLRACYLNSLALAAEYQCETVAFPLISSGAYGYPKLAAQRVAMEAIRDFLETHEMEIYLVLYTETEPELRYAGLRRWFEAHYQEPPAEKQKKTDAVNGRQKAIGLVGTFRQRSEQHFAAAMPAEMVCEESVSLEEAVRQLDESFTEMLLRKIDESGMTDVQCYKKANVDRKLFSKIRCDLHYKPKKVTAIAFAIALELSLDETKELLQKAGYALSHSSKFDVIVEYFIARGNYNVFEINEALFAFDELLIGA